MCMRLLGGVGLLAALGCSILCWAGAPLLHDSASSYWLPHKWPVIMALCLLDAAAHIGYAGMLRLHPWLRAAMIAAPRHLSMPASLQLNSPAIHPHHLHPAVCQCREYPEGLLKTPLDRTLSGL